MMSVYRVLFFILPFVTTATLFAQDQRAQEYLRQEEQRKRGELLRELDSGVYFLDRGEYLLADAKFQHVLNNIKSVPSDLTFYFGKNSFHLGKFKQSADWLNKYMQLKGTTGRYYDEAVDYLKRAESGMLQERNVEAQKASEVLSSNYDIDCGPSGKVSCPVCQGDHVITKKGAFGNEYKTCPYCNEHGILTCEEYNQLLRGQLSRKGQ